MAPPAAPEEHAALLASLPTTLRAALERGDAPALQSALDALPKAERSALVEQLLHAGIIRTGPQPRPDMDQVIQRFLPLLGDIALAADGDETARLLAEAALPGLEERGWRSQTRSRSPACAARPARQPPRPAPPARRSARRWRRSCASWRDSCGWGSAAAEGKRVLKPIKQPFKHRNNTIQCNNIALY